MEQARIHLRELDIELLREQNKITSGYYDKQHPQQHLPALPSSTSLHPPTTAAPTGIGNSSSSSSNGSSGYALAAPCNESTAGTPYYGLAPVQQQVLARITGESANSNHYSHNNNTHAGNNHHSYQQHPVIENGHATESSTLPPPAPPRSPVAYPHSAHPLCPPSEPHPYRNNSSSSSSSTWNYRQRFYPRNNAHQPTTPISPGIGDTRDHPPSLPVPSHQQQQHHHQDIQKKRGRSSTNNDGGENESITHDQVMEALKAKIQRGNNDRSKRARIPSPRSSKPILPPIDTSVGRIPSSSSSIPSVTVTAPLPSTTSPTNTTTNTSTTTDQDSKQQQSTRPTTSDTSSSSTAATEPTSTKSWYLYIYTQNIVITIIKVSEGERSK